MSSGDKHETILADLYARRDEAAQAGLNLSQMSYLNQQIVAHETLLRLLNEKAELDAEKTDTLSVREQIKFWRNMADDKAAESPELAGPAPLPEVPVRGRRTPPAADKAK